MLRACAAEQSRFVANDANSLISAFDRISRTIDGLRLAR